MSYPHCVFLIELPAASNSFVVHLVTDGDCFSQKHELSLQTVDESSSTDAVHDSSVHSDSDAKQREEPHPKALISEVGYSPMTVCSVAALKLSDKSEKKRIISFFGR